MRNLEDCKAEVFRRSKERIKERKRTRNRVLVCCIPLCLLLVAGGLYIRPLLEPVDELGGINAEDTAIPDRELGGISSGTTTAFVSVEIIDGTEDAEVSRNITNAEIVGKLCCFMAMYFEMPVEKETILADGVESDGATTVYDFTTAGSDIDTIIDDIKTKYSLDEKKADYKLVFRSSTGEEFIFRLCGNVLFDDKHDCGVTLSDTQLMVLKMQLEQAEGDGFDK